jgi:uncharacterized protein YciI
MTLYCIRFEDNEKYAHMRQAHMNAHLQFLKDHEDVVERAGPLVDATTGLPAGGMWLVKADKADSVRHLVEADPFWATGLRRSVQISEWRFVFPRANQAGATR